MLQKIRNFVTIFATQMKTHILAFSLFTLSFWASAANPTLDFPKREAATVGVCVMDINTGEFIASENYGLAMAPASTMKAVTTATALRQLGAGFRFLTEVTVTELSSDKTSGRILKISGSGDPTIESRNFPEQESLTDKIVAAMNRRGMTAGPTGITVSSEMTDEGTIPSWTIGDAGWSYGTGYYGFNCFDNYFDFNTTTYDSDPSYPFLNVELEAANTPNDIIHGIRSDDYLVTGRSVGRRGYTVRLPMNNPAEAYEFYLSDRLDSNGFDVMDKEDIPARPAADETILLKHYSPTLNEIAKSLMFRSDNMMAEAMLRAINPGSTRDAAIKLEKKIWNDCGLDPTTVIIEDGSGLSRKDRMTPRFMNEMLAFMAKSEYADDYVGFFPTVGVNGTVGELLRKTRLKGKLALKSGSLSGVQCFAGYKIGSNGKPTHTVVIFVNNFFCTRSEVRKAIENFLLEIF